MKVLPWLKDVLNTPLYQVAFILFVFEAVFSPSFSQWRDMDAFCNWSRFIMDHGIGNIYKINEVDELHTCNYPPLICYPLFVWGKIQGNGYNICTYLRFLKLFGLLADFIAALVLVKMLRNNAKEIILFLLLVANPVFIYNSYCWGQVDGILAMLVFLSFVLMVQKKPLWSVALFTMAFNFKVHAIIFLPPLVLLWYYVMHKEITVKSVLLAIIVLLGTETLIFLPFIIAGQTANAIRSFTSSVNFYPLITYNADNLWYFFFDSDDMYNDKRKWFGITYQNWGLLMFALSSFVALFPLFVSCISKFLKKSIYHPDMPSLYIAFALISILFFYLNTQMHERFGHTAIIFVAAFSFSTKRYWPFIIICLAYFGNMEGILHFFEFPNQKLLIFEPRWVASLYLLLIISLFYFLYKPFLLQLKTYRNEQPTA